MIEAYPLAWPVGWPRTKPANRQRARFFTPVRDPAVPYVNKREVTIAEGAGRVMRELGRLTASVGSIVISSNLVLNVDGSPRSKQRVPDDPGVAVYWSEWTETSPGYGNTLPRCMAIDIYDRVADNLGAVAATIEAMRAIERHGGASIMQRAFTGFTALPAPASAPHWRVVLGVTTGGADAARESYLRLRSITHPDRPGGDAEKFHAVKVAYEQACAELGAQP